MEPEKSACIKRIFSFLSLLILLLVLPRSNLFAGEPEKLPSTKPKQMILGIGIGYGVSNNPCSGCENSDQLLSGLVLNASLGYRISPKFIIDFGPSIWIEGKDVFKNNNASERPANKRMLIAFNGYYFPSKNCPLNFKLGAGIGNLLYTPEQSRVVPDSKTFEDSEFMSGLAANFGIQYSIKISQVFEIHPSVNLWYTELSNPEISYKTYIDKSKASVTSDFRINLQFDF